MPWRPSNASGSSMWCARYATSFLRGPRPLSIEPSLRNGPACRSKDAPGPSPARSSSARFPSGASPTGTTPARGSVRSISWPTTADRRSGSSVTLDLTCVATGWTEPRGLPNKAQRWVHEAIEEIANELPFPLLGLDCDNGSEFINMHLYRYCTERRITFTRSRPYRKNDNCFVEQKNWPVVRQQVGYARYDTPAELEALRELYRVLRLYVNFFQPQMKLLSKTSRGAKVTRRFDEARTPFQRILSSPEIPRPAKESLEATYLGLNPAQLKRDLVACQERLISASKDKSQGRKEVTRPAGRRLGGYLSKADASRTSFVM